MEKITVNGIELTFENKNDLQNLRIHQPALFRAIRTNNEKLIRWALELYMDELDKQDEKLSTGSYGKLAEVYDRVECAIANKQRIWLHDIHCRRQNLDDHRVNGVRYERKTGFAQWEYGVSYEDCMEKLERRANAGIVWRWEPFKDERVIEMPLRDLLDILASYNEKKGLKVWFGFVAAKGQLQIQPVKGISKKREAFIESLLK